LIVAEENIMNVIYKPIVVCLIVGVGMILAPNPLIGQVPDGDRAIAVQQWIKALQHSNATERMHAAKQLAKLGAAAEEAVPALKKATEDTDTDVRQMAAAALLRIQQATASVGGRPDLYMLSVGIDRYQAPVNNLSGCVNDAVGMAKLFQSQAGKQYGRVDAQILTDANATRAKIASGLNSLSATGKAGDWYVVVLSGHGGTTLHRWSFLTQDRGDISDATLLEFADRLAKEDKKVLIIIDACFAGQMRYAAHPVLNRHTDPRKGGIILAISSMPSQTSAALQAYSAFARAVEEGLTGMADYDRDQTITLNELRRFTYNRVYELALQRRPLPGFAVEPQDSAIDASLSMPETTSLVQVQELGTRKTADDGPQTPVPQLVGSWVAATNASGDLSNAGSLTYRVNFYKNGVFRVTLTDGTRIVRSGDGIFTTTTKTVQLNHKFGTDRLEVSLLNSEELHFRFHSRNIVLRRETAPKGSVAGTTWKGTETLGGFGSLQFQFERDGKAIRIDAKSTVNGSWTQNGNKVSVNFQNCIYEGTIQGEVFTGTARYVAENGMTWTFSVTRGSDVTDLAAPRLETKRLDR